MPEEPQLGPDEFASKIKAKYPAYAKMDNAELSKKVLAKYPTYWKGLDASKFEKIGAYQPSSSYVKSESTGKVGEETKTGKALEGVVHAAPMIGGTMGAVAGSAVAGPPGAVAGAAIGGGAGKVLEGKMTGKGSSTGQIYDASVGQGLLEATGIGAAGILSKVGGKAAGKVLPALQRYIGLKPSDLPKWGRTAEDADKVMNTVMDEAGVKGDLPAQRDAIEAARKARDVQTENLVKTPGGKLTDFHSVALDRAVNLLKEVEKEGVPVEQINAIDKNLQGVTDNLKQNMSPEELLSAKRDISKQITTWDRTTTNIRQRYLQGLYDDINASIKSALPPKEAAEFSDNNRIQHYLITAREAANEKLAAQRAKEVPGIATKAVRTAGGAVTGAVSGAGFATVTGHPESVGRDALVGGMIGAAGGRFSESLRPSTELPAMDVRAQQALAKAAPKLSKAARGLPVVERAIQAIMGTSGNQ